ELGFGAMTEIALFRDQGLKLVGPLPAPLQNFTTYVALPWPGAVAPDHADAVAHLIRHLQGAGARALFVAAGIAPAPWPTGVPQRALWGRGAGPAGVLESGHERTPVLAGRGDR